MKNSTKHIEFKQIERILDKHDKQSFYEKVNVIPDSEALYDELKKYLDVENMSTRSVLGIDIYRYSSYKHMEQALIPFLFKCLFQKAMKHSIEKNAFLFQKYSVERFENSFLSTGDGGYLILQTPLHSLLFAINFQLVVRAYNSFHLYPKLRKIIGEISLRYSITFDALYYFDNNFYGRSIINNARILQKDNLNRCLIDQPTYEWFMINTDGTENLQILTINEIANILDFQDYDKEYIHKGRNAIFGNSPSREIGIINSDILKIGNIKSKDSELDVYNLHLQVSMNISDDHNKENKRMITISLGNLNTAGI